VTIDTGGCYDEPVSTVVAPGDDGFSVTPYDRVPTGNHLACLMPMHHEAHFWFDHAGPEVIHFITTSPEVTRTIDVE
jgi:hypothetical protein